MTEKEQPSGYQRDGIKRFKRPSMITALIKLIIGIVVLVGIYIGLKQFGII